MYIYIFFDVYVYIYISLSLSLSLCLSVSLSLSLFLSLSLSLSLFLSLSLSLSLSICLSPSLSLPSLSLSIYIYIYMETDRTGAHLFGAKTHFSPQNEGKNGQKKSQKFLRIFLGYFCVIVDKNTIKIGVSWDFCGKWQKNLAKRAFRAFCKCHRLLSAEMLNMLNHVGCKPPKKTLLSAEMLNMLNMLNVFRPIRVLQSSRNVEPHAQYIQHIQHFSRKKHIFVTCWIFSAERTTFWAMLNFFCWNNHCWDHVEFFLLKEPLFGPCWIFSPETSIFFSKMCFFLLKCWICWIMLYVSAPKKRFFLLKCWKCWICWMFSGPWQPPGLQTMGLSWAKKHSTYSTYSTFQQKEAFFSEHLHPTWFNIFNISAERSTFSKTCWIFSAERIPLFGPKSVEFFQQKKFNFWPQKLNYFSRKNSTWPKKWFFQQKKFNMCRKCASFCWNVEYVECIGRVVRHFC